MASNALRNSIRLALIVCCCAVAFSFSLRAETSPAMPPATTWAYCMAESGGTVVYFSAVYDTKFQYPARVSSNVIAREFIEYLKGRYEFKPQGNFPSSCPVRNNMSDAEASKREFQARARQENKQVVEVDWNFIPDQEMIAASFSNPEEGVFEMVNQKRQPTHTYCVSEP